MTVDPVTHDAVLASQVMARRVTADHVARGPTADLVVVPVVVSVDAAVAEPSVAAQTVGLRNGRY